MKGAGNHVSTLHTASFSQARRGAEYIAAGAVGTVTETHTLLDRNFGGTGGPLTAMALTGHLAQYAGIGGKIEWDVEKMECTNKPEFNQCVPREYRSGWEV